MTQKLEALHLEALCEEVRSLVGGCCWRSGGLTAFVRVCRTCSRESRSTLRWRPWTWS